MPELSSVLSSDLKLADSSCPFCIVLKALKHRYSKIRLVPVPSTRWVLVDIFPVTLYFFSYFLLYNNIYHTHIM